MIILTDCLTNKLDEGCIKVANQLTMRIKAKRPETLVISYGNITGKSDTHLMLNKLFLNWSLFSIIRKRNAEPILYIPFSSNTVFSVIRTFVLSVFARGRVYVLYTLLHPMGIQSRHMLKASRAKVIVLSELAKEFYDKIADEAIHVRAGVDIQKFFPVSEEKKYQLREKYHIPKDKKVVLHVGHLKAGRNVQMLMNFPEEYCVILLCSSRSFQDAGLREQLDGCSNVIIIDSFLNEVEELYQLCDVYLFPVKEPENCIDAPLSVLEAAACNIPVVATHYGELIAFREESGFYFISDCDEKTILEAVLKMSRMSSCANRIAVSGYDWDAAADYMIQKISSGTEFKC